MELLATTSAVAQQLTGLVPDNESTGTDAGEAELGDRDAGEEPRQHRQALPALAKFEITVGEAVASFYYYSRSSPTLPRNSSSRSSTTCGDSALRHSSGPGFPTPVPRSLIPFPYNGIPRALDVRWAADRGDNDPKPRSGLTAAVAVVWSGHRCRRWPALRDTFFGPTRSPPTSPPPPRSIPGDEVRVSGVKVGTINRSAQGKQAKMTLEVDRDVPIPADAKAVIVAQNLVAARYVQLTPAYRDSGPIMHDGAVIPVERTAIPVEWDEVKTQLMRLATDLGPERGIEHVGGPVHRQRRQRAGRQRRQAAADLAQLSGVGRILANGSGNIVDIIKNLQTFVTALRDSNIQIVQFHDRLATLTSVVDDSRSDLDAALTDLSTAVGDVQRFIAGTRDQTTEQIARLADVTQNLVDHHMALENVLHVAPNAIANAYNIYNPDTGSIVGGSG